MKDQTISLACLSLIWLLQICKLPLANGQTRNSADDMKAEPCVAPNGAEGYCLIYTECANLTHWRIQNNIKNVEDVKEMFCGTDQIHVCCNHTNPYITETDYISSLNPQGLAILKSMSCARPRTDRVSNGDNAIIGEYPFMALLRYNGAKRPYLCGGSLITNKIVLTAAHCIQRNLVGVRLGEHDLSTDVDCVRSTLCLPPVENFEITQKIIHPNYDRVKYTNDVALLKLNSEVNFKIHIKPICLPITPLVYDYNNLPKQYSIAGWGHTEKTKNTDILQFARIPPKDREVCQSIFGPLGINITYAHICAGGEREIDTCKGDSGGPLFASVPFKKVNSITFTRIVQYGIVSFGLIGCGGENTQAAAYVNVLQYMPWITENIIV